MSEPVTTVRSEPDAGNASAEAIGAIDGEAIEAAAPAIDPQPPGAAPDDDAAPEAPARAWLRCGDQLFVGGLVIAAIVLMAVHWVRLSGHGIEPVEIDRLPERRFDFQLDVNRATWVEWMQLDGIGDTLARRIVEDRETNGPFADIDALARVRGIGPKTIERIRPWLRVGTPERDVEGEPFGE